MELLRQTFRIYIEHMLYKYCSPMSKLLCFALVKKWHLLYFFCIKVLHFFLMENPAFNQTFSCHFEITLCHQSIWNNWYLVSKHTHPIPKKQTITIHRTEKVVLLRTNTWSKKMLHKSTWKIHIRKLPCHSFYSCSNFWKALPVSSGVLRVYPHDVLQATLVLTQSTCTTP